SLLTLLVGHLTSGGGPAVVFELERVLPDDPGRLGLDALSPLPRGLPGRGHGLRGFDGRGPFAAPPGWRCGGRAAQASEFQCRRGRGACGPVEGLRLPHEQFDRLVLCDDLAQLLQRRRFVLASDHGQRSGQDAVGVAGRDPDPHRADVEAQATASAETHWMAALTAAMAAGIAAGSLPPPWARSGLPPPPPPRS